MDKSVAFKFDEDFLQERRGPIDGRKFFSRSPFRSWYFLAVTATCLIDATYDLYLLYRHWNGLSTLAAALIFTNVGLLGIVGLWVRAHRYLDRVRQLDVEGSIVNVEQGSTLDVLLGVAAGAANELLMISSSTILVLLAVIGKLMSRMPVR